MSTGTLVFRYIVFAVIATFCNLLTQRIVLFASEAAAAFALAVATGTLAGLVVKFLLDKRWIFGVIDQNVSRDTRRFALYATTGVVTTVIFWGSETLFWYVGRTELLREAGAILGLSIGYVLKYRLDKKFVFGPATTKRSVL